MMLPTLLLFRQVEREEQEVRVVLQGQRRVMREPQGQPVTVGLQEHLYPLAVFLLRWVVQAGQEVMEAQEEGLVKREALEVPQRE